jgi:peroxiredoxin
VTLRVGDRVPDFDLLRPDGRPAKLTDFLGRPLLVILLRQLG